MEQEPTGPRRRLGAELRRLRGNTGLRLDQVAHRMNCSTSKISRLETGKGLPKPGDVEALLELYDVQAEVEIAMLRRLVRESRSQGWWTDYVDGVTTERYVLDNPARYVALETDAVAVSSFDLAVPHGLAQTSAYATAFLERSLPRHAPWEIERLVLMGRHRRRALTERASPIRLFDVLDENVLCRVVGGPEVMAEQVAHLVELAGMPNVDLRVLPFAAGTYRAHTGQFVVLDIPDELGSDVVFIEGHTGGDYLEEPSELELFRGLLDEVRASALGPERSLDLLRDYRDRYASAARSAAGVVPEP